MSQITFPCWLYHKTEGAKLIASAKELEALGKGWVDSPAKFEEPQAPKEKKPKGK